MTHLTECAQVMALPLRLIPSLHVNRKQKLALAAIFSLGGIVIIVTIVRVVEIKATTQHVDPVWLALWSMIEASVGMQCSRPNKSKPPVSPHKSKPPLFNQNSSNHLLPPLLPRLPHRASIRIRVQTTTNISFFVLEFAAPQPPDSSRHLCRSSHRQIRFYKEGIPRPTSPYRQCGRSGPTSHCYFQKQPDQEPRGYPPPERSQKPCADTAGSGE